VGDIDCVDQIADREKAGGESSTTKSCSRVNLMIFPEPKNACRSDPRIRKKAVVLLAYEVEPKPIVQLATRASNSLSLVHLSTTVGHIVKLRLTCLVTAAAIAVAVWAFKGPPLPSHPDARVSHNADQH
jgi:hypothetical protein